MIVQSPKFRIELHDSSGSRAIVQLSVRAGLEPAEILAGAAGLLDVVASITDAAITGVQIIYPVAADERNLGEPGSNVRSAGVFFGQTAVDGELGLVTIPSIKTSMLQTTGPGAGILIDLDNEDVQAFVDEWIGGIWVNPFANDITELASAYYQVR